MSSPDRPSRPLRVVHVVFRLSKGAGIPVVVRRLADGVDPAEVELHVLTARGLKPGDDLEEVPAAVHPLGPVPRRARFVPRPYLMLAVARAVRRLHPDVVQLHSGTAWMGAAARLVARRAGFVLEVHDAPGSGRHSALTDWLEGWWVRVGGAVAVCHSSSVRAEIERRWRPRPGRVVMFPLAVDADLFQPLSAARRRTCRQRLGIPDDLTLLVAVGRFAPSKRFDRVVEAVAAIRPSHDVGLVLVGGGKQRTMLEELVARRGLEDRVWFTGPRHGAELAEICGASDILCSPSEYEGFGLTLIEGMAAGVPSVAVAVGGVTDLVVDGVTGWLVEPSEADRFPDRVRDLVLDPELRRKMGLAGRERVEQRFSIPTFVDAFVDLYRRCAGGAGRAGAS